MSSSKGSSFERELCKRLSEWASFGQYDDVFWRTAGSGARATTRKKQGADTRGQFGDIGVTRQGYNHFVEQLLWELKRGYPSADVHKLIENPRRTQMENNPLYKFFVKTLNTAEAAGANWWVVVTRRNAGRILFWMPTDLVATIEVLGATVGINAPTCRVVLPDVAGCVLFDVTAIGEEDFFEINPKVFAAAIGQTP